MQERAVEFAPTTPTEHVRAPLYVWSSFTCETLYTNQIIRFRIDVDRLDVQRWALPLYRLVCRLNDNMAAVMSPPIEDLARAVSR